jgi:hypothetical protein
MAEILESKGVEVSTPSTRWRVACPGMNVLLAEADVEYDAMKEMDDINGEFSRTDVTLVIGANDVTNPAARNDSSSPIYGMPILNVDQSRSVIVLKRSMSSGYAGIENPLFTGEHTLDAVRRRQEVGRRGHRGTEGALGPGAQLHGLQRGAHVVGQRDRTVITEQDQHGVADADGAVDEQTGRRHERGPADPADACAGADDGGPVRLGEEVHGVLGGDQAQPAAADVVDVREQRVHRRPGVLVQRLQREVAEVAVGVHIAVAGGDVGDHRV